MEGAPLKRVVVTGGNSGIGPALCEQLATEIGCHVYMGSRSKERGEAAVAGLPEGCKGKVELLVVDVASQESVTAAVADLTTRLGGAKLYGLVNNAGTGLQHKVTAAEMV